MRRLGLTQRQLGEALGIHDQPTISRLLRGQRELSAERAVQLAETLGCSVEWLLTGREPSAEGKFDRRLAALPTKSRQCLEHLLDALERDVRRH